MTSRSLQSPLHHTATGEAYIVIHYSDVSHPPHWVSDNQGISAGELHAIQDLQVGDMIMPTDAKSGM